MHTTRVVVLVLCQIASSGCEGRGRCASWEWGQPKKNPGVLFMHTVCIIRESTSSYCHMRTCCMYDRTTELVYMYDAYTRRVPSYACAPRSVDSFFLIDTACGEGDFWAIKKRNKKNNHPPKNSAAPLTASCGTCLSSYLPCEFLFSNGENVMENHACLPD